MQLLIELLANIMYSNGELLKMLRHYWVNIELGSHRHIEVNDRKC